MGSPRPYQTVTASFGFSLVAFLLEVGSSEVSLSWSAHDREIVQKFIESYVQTESSIDIVHKRKQKPVPNNQHKSSSQTTAFPPVPEVLQFPQSLSLESPSRPHHTSTCPHPQHTPSPQYLDYTLLDIAILLAEIVPTCSTDSFEKIPPHSTWALCSAPSCSPRSYK